MIRMEVTLLLNKKENTKRGVKVLGSMNTISISFWGLLGFFVFTLVACAAALEYTTFAVIFGFIGVCIIGKGIIHRQKQLFSLTLVFWGFSALYALSVPLAIIFGEETDPTFIGGNLTRNVNPFLFAYALSCLGFILGQINYKANKCYETNIKVNNFDYTFNVNLLKRGAIISAFLASLFETINLFRIGGTEMLFMGKGVYQSNVGDLFLTLPSHNMYSICGIFLGILLAYSKLTNYKEKNNICLMICILFLVPFLTCKILLGMRGTLISAVLTGIASYTVFVPIKKFSWKLFLWGILIYVFLVFLYTNRGIVSLLVSNPTDFFSMAFDLERLEANFNPGNSEFGAAFGNFCVYFERYGTDFSKYLGLTYIQGLAVPIPSFLYPGDKPLQITYAFRDEFFASWALRSRIASTGFSSILEGYINGGFLGIFVIYLVWGKLLKLADNVRLKKTSIIGILLSSILVDTCMEFSRTAFGGILGEYIWKMIYCIFIYLVAKYLRISFWKSNRMI